MPRLLAVIPEDGWALVRENAQIVFVRPPFRSAERVPVPEPTLADAVSVHGYKAQAGAPDEPWASVIDRIREIMVREGARTPLLSDEELLRRTLHSGPSSVATGLLERVERDWLATGNLRAAERALQALLSEERVKADRALLDRALDLHRRLDDRRAARVPGRAKDERIVAISRLPRVADCRARMRGGGAAAMVGGG